MSGFIEQINNLDGQLLLLINNHNCAFFDNFFYTYSGKFVWFGIYAAIIAYCLFRWRIKGLWIVLALILSVVAADQISSHLIKPIVCRLRPTHDLVLSQYVHIVNEYRGGLYGFVSSHAANSFAVAMLMHLISRDKFVGATLFTWACINAYSRMYLGVHFPSDIVCGALVGILVAVILHLVTKKYFKQFNDSLCNMHIIKWIVPGSFIITLLAIVIFSII